MQTVLDAFTARRDDVGERTLIQYAVAVRQFDAFAGGDLPPGPEAAEKFDAWIPSMLDAGKSERTVNNKRQAILTLWRWALAERLADSPPPQVDRVREPADAPPPYTADEIGRLLDACARARTLAPAGEAVAWTPRHWHALVLVLRETSLQIGRVLDLAGSAFDGARLVVDGAPHELRRETAEALAALPPADRLFPWPFHRRTVWTEFRGILATAGLPRGRRDLFERVRRGEGEGGSAEPLRRPVPPERSAATHTIPRRRPRPEPTECEEPDVAPTMPSTYRAVQPAGHPDAGLTLREAFERHYDREELAVGTQKYFLYTLTRWERATGNPPIAEIDNLTAARFRKALLDDGLAPGSIKSHWTNVRAIMRALCEPRYGNPHGLGIVPGPPPWMKPVKPRRKPPRRIALDDLDRFYVYARHASYPATLGCEPADWWRALLVVAYFTGLRKGDLFRLRYEQIDPEECTLYVEAGKTSKEDVFPLHPVAVEHVERIRTPRRLVFPCGSLAKGGDYTQAWHDIRNAAGVERFTLHDVRRTAASEIERVRTGLAAVFLQHAPRSVTDAHYVNRTEELREAIEAMRVPIAFKHGPTMVERDLKQREERTIRMRPDEFARAGKPDPGEWVFVDSGSFWFRGRMHKLSGAPWRVLKALALGEGPQSLEALAAAKWPNGPGDRKPSTISSRVNAVISFVRDKLRVACGLPPQWNPIPCIERGHGGKWTLHLPPDSRRARTREVA